MNANIKLSIYENLQKGDQLPPFQCIEKFKNTGKLTGTGMAPHVLNLAEISCLSVNKLCIASTQVLDDKEPRNANDHEVLINYYDCTGSTRVMINQLLEKLQLKHVYTISITNERDYNGQIGHFTMLAAIWKSLSTFEEGGAVGNDEDNICNVFPNFQFLKDVAIGVAPHVVELAGCSRLSFTAVTRSCFVLSKVLFKREPKDVHKHKCRIRLGEEPPLCRQLFERLNLKNNVYDIELFPDNYDDRKAIVPMLTAIWKSLSCFEQDNHHKEDFERNAETFEKYLNSIELDIKEKSSMISAVIFGSLSEARLPTFTNDGEQCNLNSISANRMKKEFDKLEAPGDVASLMKKTSEKRTEEKDSTFYDLQCKNAMVKFDETYPGMINGWEIQHGRVMLVLNKGDYNNNELLMLIFVSFFCKMKKKTL
ncbi:hypothetical protein CRE_00483 [Caenorhabditis remanei]|uniref:Switch protein XOL-1 N-terminal domain-containing protein n=1 Tax=Caenorhabditis remanei TaxID=31234 RepID=E3LC92_CAERE|nr:hypothetical protein CRE_00483 [Caenorhabditis remanei]